MKIPSVGVLICVGWFALFAVAEPESADAWKSGSVAYKVKESGGSSGTITLHTQIAVSSGSMVVSIHKQTDWSNENQPEKAHDVHQIDDTVSVALRDIDPNNFDITKDESGTPAFWMVHVNSARKGAVRNVSLRDHKDSTAKDGESLVIAYDNPEVAMKAVEEIRILARQAAAPKK
jgi:hypothetical protein